MGCFHFVRPSFREAKDSGDLTHSTPYCCQSLCILILSSPSIDFGHSVIHSRHMLTALEGRDSSQFRRSYVYVTVARRRVCEVGRADLSFISQNSKEHTSQPLEKQEQKTD